MRTADQVARTIEDRWPGFHLVEDALHEFCIRGLMLEEAGHYLSLATPVNRTWGAVRDDDLRHARELPVITKGGPVSNSRG